jgi:hypothetical protein
MIEPTDTEGQKAFALMLSKALGCPVTAAPITDGKRCAIAALAPGCEVMVYSRGNVNPPFALCSDEHGYEAFGTRAELDELVNRETK